MADPEPLLPKGNALAGHKWSRRQLLDGIRWRVRVGAPWRDVPESYGHWRQWFYIVFRRWQLDGCSVAIAPSARSA